MDIIRPIRRSFVPIVLLLPGLMATGQCPSDPDPDPGSAQWYATCGDPVCSGYTGPFDGVPLCTDETIGDSCDTEGGSCDPEDACNALVTCATEDPTAQVGGCPISKRAYKREIRYLTEAERSGVAQQALGVRLSTWRYHWDDQHGQAHLGFIIDDVGQSPAVTADGGHVDLYGYTSMTLAAVQAQEARLQAQDARIRELESQLSELLARDGAACPAEAP